MKGLIFRQIYGLWGISFSSLPKRMTKKQLSNFTDADQLEQEVKSWIGNAGYGFGQVMPPLRLALVGEMKGPHISNIMALVGKEESISRIRAAIETLG